MDEEFTTFVLSYENGDKVHVAVVKPDFMSYLSIFVDGGDERFTQYDTGTSDWTFRIWFLDGLVSFIAARGTRLITTSLFPPKGEVMRLARSIADDGYEFSRIFQW